MLKFKKLKLLLILISFFSLIIIFLYFQVLKAPERIYNKALSLFLTSTPPEQVQLRSNYYEAYKYFKKLIDNWPEYENINKAKQYYNELNCLLLDENNCKKKLTNLYIYKKFLSLYPDSKIWEDIYEDFLAEYTHLDYQLITSGFRMYNNFNQTVLYKQYYDLKNIINPEIIEYYVYRDDSLPKLANIVSHYDGNYCYGGFTEREASIINSHFIKLLLNFKKNEPEKYNLIQTKTKNTFKNLQMKISSDEIIFRELMNYEGAIPLINEIVNSLHINSEGYKIYSTSSNFKYIPEELFSLSASEIGYYLVTTSKPITVAIQTYTYNSKVKKIRYDLLISVYNIKTNKLVVTKYFYGNTGEEFFPFSLPLNQTQICGGLVQTDDIHKWLLNNKKLFKPEAVTLKNNVL